MRAEAQWFRRRYQSDNFGSWETDENVLWANLKQVVGTKNQQKEEPKNHCYIILCCRKFIVFDKFVKTN